jgi:hypothetical protein
MKKTEVQKSCDTVPLSGMQDIRTRFVIFTHGSPQQEKWNDSELHILAFNFGGTVYS